MTKEWLIYLKGWPEKPNETVIIFDDKHASYEYRGNPVQLIDTSFAMLLMGLITAERLLGHSNIAHIEYIESE